MTDKTIFIFDAQEGDKLADDVHTPDGNILAKKDTILNYDIIANISGHHNLTYVMKKSAYCQYSYIFLTKLKPLPKN